MSSGSILIRRKAELLDFNVATGIYCGNYHQLCVPVDNEQYAPTSNAGFTDARPFRERCRETRIEGTVRELNKSGTNSLLGWAIKSV